MALGWLHDARSEARALKREGQYFGQQHMSEPEAINRATAV